jgi:dTDP-4-amino-4,6-dideoxygalactose transaminase
LPKKTIMNHIIRLRGRNNRWSLVGRGIEDRQGPQGVEGHTRKRHTDNKMDEPHLERMPRFSTIAFAEKVAVSDTLRRPLSGYLGGVDKSEGYYVNRLIDKWCEEFRCKYAIPCNSATSGLLAACMAIGIKPGDTVWVSAMGMSATAACAKVLGAHIVFIDVETIRFSMNMNMMPRDVPRCVIITSLFGHPAYLSSIRSWCDSNDVWMIEDAAQAPFAMEAGKYAGTIGHIGVFSFNVHKHIQAGEGGICVTDDHALAEKLAGAINHGELAHRSAGLNLRMTEPTAAIACAQLARASHIIESRRHIAYELTEMVAGIPWITAQTDDVDCKHVYYRWVARVDPVKRHSFVGNLNARGFPMVSGYSPTLNRIFNGYTFECHVAQDMEDRELISFGVCEWEPKTRHFNQMREIIKRVAEGLT